MIDNSLKSEIIDHIYSHINLSNFRYGLLTKKNDLDILKSNSFHLSGNYVGENCFLIFYRKKNKNYVFLVNRLTLVYSRSKLPPLDKIEIREITLKTIIPSQLFEGIGSIFDGNLIKLPSNNFAFLIMDIFYFCGKNKLQEFLSLKLDEIREFFSKYDIDSREQKNNMIITVSIKVNTLHLPSSIETFLLKAKKEEYSIRGLCFYPLFSGVRYIFGFNRQIEKETSSSNNTKNNKYKKKEDVGSNGNSENLSNNKNYELVNPTTENISAVLAMEMTSLPDVYNMYATKKLIDSSKNDETQKNTKNFLLEPMSIAYISTTKHSKWCKSLFKDNNKRVLVNCNFNNEKKKWEPISLAENAKIPTFFDDIKLLVLVKND